MMFVSQKKSDCTPGVNREYHIKRCLLSLAALFASLGVAEHATAACTPYSHPAVGLFINKDQDIWHSSDEAKGDRSVTYTRNAPTPDYTLTVSGPNGSITLPGGSTVVLRHKFFGNNNFLAVSTSLLNGSLAHHTVFIVDFTAPSIRLQDVLDVDSSALLLPWVQYSTGSGSACLVGDLTSDGNTCGLAILRSDTGETFCAYPSSFRPTGQIVGEATSDAVQINQGSQPLAGPCPFPSGKLKVQPISQIFNDVKVNGCPQPPSTKQFTLKNVGTDCLSISAITDSVSYIVTSKSTPFPADLAPGQTMTVTVTFAPTSVGTFNNVPLSISRSPANGDDKLTCSGRALAAQPAYTVSPSTLDFGRILVGSPGAKSFIIENTGDVSISASVAQAPLGSEFQWIGFSGTLSCGQSHSMQVTFTPQSVGVVQNTASVVSAPGGSKPVTFMGSGCIASPRISVPAAPFPAFGDVTWSNRIPQSITITNTGEDTLTFAASISGADAALFGLMKPSQSLTDVATNLTYELYPTFHCGGGPTGDGRQQVMVVFNAIATPPKQATATLTIYGHNDSITPASFTYTMTANVISPPPPNPPQGLRVMQ